MDCVRLHELSRLATMAIEECGLYEETGDVSLAFWQGVKTVVDELLADIDPGGSCRSPEHAGFP